VKAFAIAVIVMSLVEKVLSAGIDVKYGTKTIRNADIIMMS
jgi:hypothetical protein